MASPVQLAQNDKLAQLLAGPAAGDPPSPGAAPGSAAAPPSPTTQALQSASQQLDGANPQGLLQVLQQMNGDLAQVYLMMSQRIPDGTKDISNAREAIGRVIKIVQKAAQTQVAVAPIVNQAGIGPQMSAPTNGQPDISALLGMQ